MKLRSRRASYVLTGVLVIVLCCVSALSAGAQRVSAQRAAAGRPLIGFSDRFIAGNTWLTTLAKGAQAEGPKLGYNVEVDDAQGDASRQISQMKTFLVKGAKAIIIEPVSDQAVSAGIAAVRKAHVPLIVVNDLLAPALGKEAFCNVHDNGGKTSELVGREVARVAAQKFAHRSQIKLYVQAIFPHELVTQTRENGFMKGWNSYFKQHKGPKTVRVPDQYGHALPDFTLPAMRNVLTANPDINVIFNETDVVTGAVEQALISAHLMNAGGTGSKVVLGSFDGGMSVVRAMAAHRSAVVADGLNQPFTQSALAVQEAVAAINGKKAIACPGSPPTRILPSVIVMPKTAAHFIDNRVPFAHT